MALTEIDRNLLQRCLDSEPGAWKDFVDRFIGLFVHVINHSAQARNMRLSPQDLDDLCADVFLSLLEKDCAVLRQFRGQSSLATYLTVISRRIVVRELVRRQMNETRERFAANDAMLGNRSETEEPIQRIENRDEVQELLRGLPTHEAEVVRQFHLEGKSYQEISEQTGIPQNSIGPTLTRARDRLRKSKVRS